MTPAELRAWVADSRARQGLGPTITDPAAQQQVAAMAAEALTRPSVDGADHVGGGSTAAGATRRLDPKQRHRRSQASAGADAAC
jgi:hypothetical protein